VDEMSSVARATRQRSMAQEGGGRWGIRFSNSSTSVSSYTVFRGYAFATGTIDRQYSLPTNVNFSNPFVSSTYDLVFSPLAGSVPERKVFSVVSGRGSAPVGDLVVNTLGIAITRLEKGVVGYWHLDENTSSTAYDASGFANTGALYSSSTICSNPPTAGCPSWQSGSGCKAGACLSFDGTYNYVQIPSAGSLNPAASPFSVEIWFKLNSAGSLSGSILYNKENLYEASAGGGYFSYAWQPYWAWTSAFSVNIGEWYQAVVVYDGANQSVYKNGTLVYSRVQTGSMGANTNALRIGARGAPGAASSFFPGIVDEIRVYNKALTATEIQAMYNDLK